MSTTANYDETTIEFALIGHLTFDLSELPGFTVDKSINKYKTPSPVGINFTYTHDVTDTEMRFFVSPGVNPHTEGHYVLSSYRFSGDTLNNPVARELINPERKKKLGVHGSGAYFGPKEKILIPIQKPGDYVEFSEILDRVNKALNSALETMDRDVTDVTEDDDMDKKLASVVEIDKTLAEYQELLHNEFNN